MTTSLFALALLAAGASPPAGETQPVNYYGYYRCVEQHPTGTRYCYRVPRVKKLDIQL